MRLNDSHFIFPAWARQDPDKMVGMIQRCLANAAGNQDVWSDPRMDWHDFIWRECLEKGLHPAWVLVSLQRERSLIGRDGKERDFDYAQGVVGQDEPGTSHPRWNGLPAQIMLSIRTAAWLGNIGPRENFGYDSKLWSSQPRFTPGAQVQLLDANHANAGLWTCESMAEFIQLMFTPHKEVLDVNGSIYEKWVKPFFE